MKQTKKLEEILRELSELKMSNTEYKKSKSMRIYKYERDLALDSLAIDGNYHPTERQIDNEMALMASVSAIFSMIVIFVVLGYILSY